jgi:glycosyltransferase involved in cell wall biosynthesis
MAQVDSGDTFVLHSGRTPNPVIKNFELPNASINWYKYGVLGRFKNFFAAITTGQPQILHGHGLWQMPVHQMAVQARRYQIPYLISPRGMLEPWSLKQSPLKKQIAMQWYQSGDLKNARVLHATAQMEAEQFRRLGFKNPIAIIPNGIDIEAYPLKGHVSVTDKKTLLFLSRLHPKKGIEVLIEAWSEVSANLRTNWQVDIVGNGDVAYINALKQQIANKGLGEQIHIHPPRYGADKVTAYQNAALFVLPTYSENFGIVVAEALATGTPVITTQGTPWQQLDAVGCGWCIPTGKEALVKAFEAALQLPESTLNDMGVKGHRWITSNYSMTAVAKNMHHVYQWMLGKASRPDFVYLDKAVN